MYDVNGNEFFENRPSMQEAEELIEKLRKKGKDAVIGPRAPIDIYGKKINCENEDVVGELFVLVAKCRNILKFQ